MEPNGFYYFPNFLTSEEENQIMEYLNNNSEWFSVIPNTKSRKVIHYGYEYPYQMAALSKSNSNANLKKIQDIPEIFAKIIKKVYDIPNLITLLDKYDFDQLIINKYDPGQGISPHIDSTKFFDKIIVCITIGSGINIEFQKLNSNNKFEAYVEPKSLYVMSGDARYKWTHSISKKNSDVHNNFIVPRKTRISLTFRKVLK